MKEIISDSRESTLLFGENLGKNARPGDIFALYGELGTGKTVIAKGIARGMGLKEEITSPTFTILEIYESPLPLYHFDLYRIEKPDEFQQLGFEEYWCGGGVSVIEWADRAEGIIPAEATRIRLYHMEGDRRRITIERSDH